MAEQDVDFFDYIREDRRPVLLDKIEYIDESFDDFKKQRTFNKRLNQELTKLEISQYSFTILQLNNIVKPSLEIRGYKFYKTKL